MKVVYSFSIPGNNSIAGKYSNFSFLFYVPLFLYHNVPSPSFHRRTQNCQVDCCICSTTKIHPEWDQPKVTDPIVSPTYPRHCVHGWVQPLGSYTISNDANSILYTQHHNSDYGVWIVFCVSFPLLHNGILLTLMWLCVYRTWDRFSKGVNEPLNTWST